MERIMDDISYAAGDTVDGDFVVTPEVVRPLPYSALPCLFRLAHWLSVRHSSLLTFHT